MVLFTDKNWFSQKVIMSRRCIIKAKGKEKGVMYGNNVSHSNRKTRRRFLPNVQNFALQSLILNKTVKLHMTTSGVRTIEHNNGLDDYLISTANSKLTTEALLIKKQILKSQKKRESTLHSA